MSKRRWHLEQGDALEVLRTLPDESFTAVLCDPPYGLKFMGKEWDHGVPSVEVWAEVLRVLKPGAVLMAFGGTRTWHRLAVAIEDAGFELFDTMMWLYGSGFPKSHNIGKAIDKRGGYPQLAREIGQTLKAERIRRGLTVSECDREFCGGTTNWSWFEGRPKGQRAPTPVTFARIVEAWPNLASLAEKVDEAERKVVGQSTHKSGIGNKTQGHYTVGGTEARYVDITAPATDAAKVWDGYGTALKPSFEPILLARKPRRATYAQTAMEHGTGALNIDGCRVASGKDHEAKCASVVGLESNRNGACYSEWTQKRTNSYKPAGRWPSNLLLSHLPECQRVGEKRVKGTKPGGIRNTALGLMDDDAWEPKPTIRPGNADPDGLETVEAWKCAEGCPVAALDRQSGVLKSGDLTGQPRSENRIYGKAGATLGRPRYYKGNKGFASRFFQTFEGERFRYVAKASRAEREEGLQGHLPCLTCGEIDSDHHFDKKGKKQPCRRNPHPTIKPLALCEYLARLIVPPREYTDFVADGDVTEATLLVPFCGSGSEIIGAFKAGWHNVTGIDISAEYLEIARLRIEAWKAELEQQEMGL